MKKSGFSLAEVLITMAIIAISASMLIPAYINLKPDRYKFKVLNCYKALNEVTEDLISNRDLYFQSPAPESIPADYYINIAGQNSPEIVNPNTKYGCLGLACTQQTNLDASSPFLNNFLNSDYSGVCKYPNLLVKAMELSNIQKCSSSNRTASGISSNRIRWQIEPEDSSGNQYWSGRTYKVTIDMNRGDNPNKYYGQDGERHPDRFLFRVDAGGDIIGHTDDPLTQQYLRNMTNIQKQDDYNAAQNGG